MAQITIETIETLNIAQVLASLKKEQDAERALEAQSRALGVTKQQLTKTLTTQAKAAEAAAAVEVRAAEKTALAEAKAADKAQKAAERAARGPSEWTLALQANSKAINDHRGALNQQAEALGKASSLLGALSPELASVTGGLQKAPGATAAVGTALNAAGASATVFTAAAAPITAVLAAGGFAWSMYSDHVKAGEEALKAAREEADRVREVMKRLAEEQFGASIEAQVLAGKLTEVEGATLKATHAIGESYGDAITQAVDKMDGLKGKIDEIDATLQKGQMGINVQKLRAERAQLSDSLEIARDEYDTLNAAINQLEGTTAGNIKTAGEQAEADKKGAAATKDRKAAVKDLNEALREQERIEAELDKTEQMARERKAKEDREAVEAEMKRRKDLQAAYLQMVEERTAAEKKAAEDAAAAQSAAIAGITGQIGAATTAVKDYYGEESNAGKAAAWLELGLAEAQLWAKGATFGPGAGLYIAAGQIPLALAAAKLAGLGSSDADATVTDTPRPLQAGPSGATIRVAPFDKVVAARRDDDLRAQVGGGRGGSTSVALILNGRTLQAVSATAKKGQRREGRTQPTGQRRRTG